MHSSVLIIILYVVWFICSLVYMLFGSAVNIAMLFVEQENLNVLMETKGGKKSSSSSSSRSFYEAPLGYSIEDVRPNGGIKKFRSAAYSNVCVLLVTNCYFCCLYCVMFYADHVFSSYCSALANHPDIPQAEFRTRHLT